VTLHGRDLFGNDAAISAGDVRISVVLLDGGASAFADVLTGGVLCTLEFTMDTVGAHRLTVSTAASSGVQREVAGSGGVVTAFRDNAPKVPTPFWRQPRGKS